MAKLPFYYSRICHKFYITTATKKKKLAAGLRDDASNKEGLGSQSCVCVCCEVKEGAEEKQAGSSWAKLSNFCSNFTIDVQLAAWPPMSGWLPALNTSFN